MLTSQHIEDIFLQFYDLVIIDQIPVQAQDHAACSSFYSVLIQGKELTQNQANFILKLLTKYQAWAIRSSLDYGESLKNPQWKNSFRILDLSKKIFVEKNDIGVVMVCLKFPYQLKKEFDDEFENHSNTVTASHWDSERKLRQFNIYDCNLIQIYEFAQRHGFEIDDTFMIALAEVEEIWQNQEEILPISAVVNGQVILANSSPVVDEWFRSRASWNVGNDLLLAKSMGYIFGEKPKNSLEKIAASNTNMFWVKTNADLFSLMQSLTGKIVIVLDRTADKLTWIKNFVQNAEEFGIDTAEIKVCFRESKDNQTGLNDYIKEKKLGGPINNSRIMIFEYKPAKWLFKEQENVIMLVSNNLYPSTNQMTKDWFNSHPLVIYLGDIKPSTQRGHNIVEL